jgi:hypothetical protein
MLCRGPLGHIMRRAAEPDVNSEPISTVFSRAVSVDVYRFAGRRAMSIEREVFEKLRALPDDKQR